MLPAYSGSVFAMAVIPRLGFEVVQATTQRHISAKTAFDDTLPSNHGRTSMSAQTSLGEYIIELSILKITIHNATVQPYHRTAIHRSA